MNLSFRHVKEGKTETGGYPFRSPRSSRWMPNCRAWRILKRIPVIPGRGESREPGIHSHQREYGFRPRRFATPRNDSAGK
ncbi:hypothetical protein BJS_05405 [Bradyrhizobium japonicum SEMIA 5079]|nr:hypothetical protein BJS_05405 [Bradyrhizobium japonicum SEMIA 5079]